MKRSSAIIFLVLCVFVSIWNSIGGKETPSSFSDQTYTDRSRDRLQVSFDNMKEQFTPGFKAQRVDFDSASAPARVQTDCSQGKIFKTQTNTNLAIDGQGWFVLQKGKDRLYSRDGRFDFQNGKLTNYFGEVVMAYPLDSEANIKGEICPIELTLDPNTKLYAGKYTDFRFTEDGRFYGVSKLTDPVTGQVVEVTTPLYQVALSCFENSRGLERRGQTSFALGQAGKPIITVPGVGVSGRIAVGSLELSNVDYMSEGLLIGKAKSDFQNAVKATVLLFGDLSPETVALLREQEVVVQTEGKLHTLQGRDPMSLIKALAKAHSQASDAEQVFLEKALKTAGPKIVFEE